VTSGTERSGGDRFFVLRSRALGADPRLLSQAASRLQFEGTLAVDIARLTSGQPRLRLGPAMGVRDSPTLQWLRIPDLPGVGERLRHAVEYSYSLLVHDPTSRDAKQRIAAIRWLSLVLTRWSESPPMAATLLYVALETAYNGCVVRHKRSLGRVASVLSRS
jgi:hypothetical protein